MEISSSNRLARFKPHVLIVLTIIFLSLYQFKPAFIESTMLRMDDWKYALPLPQGEAEPYDDVVVVEVDERSINELGRWPWNRKLIADLLAGLTEARVVGLDTVFSETSDADADQALARVIGEGHFILGYFFRDTATQNSTLAEDDLLDECGYNNVQVDSNQVGVKQFAFVESNIPLISDNMLTCGYFNVQPDVDGLYRRYRLAYLYKGVLLAPLAVQMAKYIVDKEPEMHVGRRGVEDFQLGQVGIHDSDTLRVLFDKPVVKVSATDIIHDRVARNYFRNKAVIVGITELGLFDMRPTPYEVITPGVYLHYYALRNLLNNNIIVDLGGYNIFFIVLFSLLAFYISTIDATNKRILGYGILIGCLFALSAGFFVGLKWWMRDAYVLMSMLALIPSLEIINIVVLRLETSKTKSALSSYISKELMKQVLDHPEKMNLGGEEREVTTLFADIRNFTSLSEKLTPTHLVELLNEIFDPLTNKILDQGGMLDKYIGDAIMAIYNAPIDQERHAKSACLSALDMVKEISSINARLQQKQYPMIDIGIGINTGLAVVGNMGSRIRFNYTAIGDSVNLASRIEGLNKYYGTRILLSEFTAAELDDTILLRKIDKIRVKGKEEAILIYEVLDDEAENRQLKSQYEAAFDLYQAGEFEKARTAFAGLLQTRADKCSEVMMRRCDQLQGQPPAMGWDGVYVFETK